MRKLVLIICILISLLGSVAWAEENQSLELNARAAVLVEPESGNILYAKNPDMKWSPASTTKLMAALLILENGKLTDSVTMSYSSLSNLPGLYRSLYLSAGDRLSVDQLLHVLLLVSDNGACNMLGEYLDGSQEKFIERMNARAVELGCTSTHFTSTFGMTDSNHKVSAMDLYRIARECMKYPLFREIVASDNYHLVSSYLDINLHTCNQIVDRSSYNYDSRAVGVKTGFTRDAQCNLVTCAVVEGKTLYSVVLGAPRTGYGDLSYPDTKKLLDYGFVKLSELEAERKAAEALKMEQQKAESSPKKKVKNRKRRKNEA